MRYRDPIVWNSIPKAIRESTSYKHFKGRLKQASRILDKIQFEKEACLIKSKEPDFFILLILTLCFITIWNFKHLKTVNFAK